jgi:hypothetical protein
LRSPTEKFSAKIAKLIRSADSNISLKAMSLHADREKTQREAAAADEASDYRAGIDAAFKLDGIYVAPCIARAWKDLVLGAPRFELYASLLKRRFPELWQQYREPLVQRAVCGERDPLERFDELGGRQELTDEQFRAALTIKGMAADGSK